jgi:hypothetical protein
MIWMALINRFKKLDVYAKLPKDISQSTYAGALLTFLSLFIMTLLLVNEYYSFIKVKTASEMFIDVNRGGDKVFDINIAYDKFRY